MIIENIFRDKFQIIRNAIEQMPVENCLNNFTKYLLTERQGNQIDEFEKKYIELLREGGEEFVLGIYADYYNSLTKEELVKQLLNIEQNGRGCICDCVYDCEFVWLLSGIITEEKAHEYIKNYMLNVLDKLYNEMNQVSQYEQ